MARLQALTFVGQLGAYLVDSRIGRRWSLAGSTFITAIFCAVFVVVQHPWAVRASTVGVNLSATVSQRSLFLVPHLVSDMRFRPGYVGGAVWVRAHSSSAECIPD